MDLKKNAVDTLFPKDHTNKILEWDKNRNTTVEDT